MTKKEEMKQKAIELMRALDIYKPYIAGFEKENKVCFFEQYGGFWVDQEPEVEKKMKELEEKHNCCVYAITHEYLEFGECYSFLIVPKYKSDWKLLLVPWNNNRYSAYAYVWNKDDEWCSEFGAIGVQCFGGGIKRIA